MDEELISVIIPVYNVEAYLKQCISSVLAQTYKNLQIILVDDGSNDSSGKLCDEFSRCDDRIAVIHKENGGLSDARNEGLKWVKGNYFAFVDSDDFIHPQMFEILYKAIKEYKAEIALCRREEISEEKPEYKRYMKLYGQENTFINEKLQGHLLDDNNIKNSPYEVICGKDYFNQLYMENSVDYIVAWNKLYDKRLLKYLHFPERKIHEDEFAIPMVSYRAEKIVYKKIPLYYYVRRKGSITVSGFSLKNLDLEEALTGRINFYKEEKLDKLIGKGAHHFIGQGLYDVKRMGKENKQYKKQLLKKISFYYFRYFFSISHKVRDGKNLIKEWVKFFVK